MPILKMQVQNGLNHMQSNKIPHSGITTEMINILEKYGIDQVTRMLSTVFDTEDILPNLCTFFTAIFKKSVVLECEQQ